MKKYFFPLLIFLSIASSLVFTIGYSLFPLILSIISAGYLIKNFIHKTDGINKDALIFAACSWIFAIIGILIDLYHNAHVGAYEIYIPFITMPFCFWLFSEMRLSLKYFYAGAATSALLGFFYSAYSYIFLDIGRPSLHSTAISFGNTSVLLAIICCMGYLSQQSTGRSIEFWKPLMITGIASGILTSLLSGSKGGWFTLVTFTLYFYWLFSKHLSRNFKVLSALGLICITATIFLHPSSPVHKRMSSAIDGAQHWFQTRKDIDGSVGSRLSMWSFGLSNLEKVPMLGLGRRSTDVLWRESAESSETDIKWAPDITDSYDGNSFHNEILTVFYWRGYIGLLSWLSIYIAAFYLFKKNIKLSSTSRAKTGLLGIFVLLSYFEFSLTDAGWFVNANRQIFMFIVTFLISYIIQERNNQ